MDALNDDRGQALAVVVLLLAIASATVAGLHAGQERLVAATRSHRAGEAAVEAASASLADAYVAHLAAVGARSRDASPPAANVGRLVADPRVVDDARMAANDLARENRSGPIEAIAVGCAAGRVEVRIALAGYSHRAGFDAPECSRP
jgi:hypothetical protein